jgi:TfoX/Sxy family transcriptional regulator of competence genes
LIKHSESDDLVYNEQLANRIETMVRRKGLSEKKMFGGVAFLLNGNMCFGVAKDDLMVRVGPERYEDALSLPNARPMDITGHSMKGFVFVDTKGWSRNASLAKWLEMGLDYAASLPKKK